MIATKQINEHKFKRIWSNTESDNRSYVFDPDKNTYSVICNGDYFLYKRVWNVETDVVLCKRIYYKNMKGLFDLLWRTK